MISWRRCKPLDLCQYCVLILPELPPEVHSPLQITPLQSSEFHPFPTTLQRFLHCASAPVVPHSHNSHHLLLFLISIKSSFFLHCSSSLLLPPNYTQISGYQPCSSLTCLVASSFIFIDFKGYFANWLKIL